MGGEELKWRQLAHHQLVSQQGPHFSPHSKAVGMNPTETEKGAVASRGEGPAQEEEEKYARDSVQGAEAHQEREQVTEMKGMKR